MRARLHGEAEGSPHCGGSGRDACAAWDEVGGGSQPGLCSRLPGFYAGHNLQFDPGQRIGSMPLFSHLGMGKMTVLTVLGYHEGWLDEFRSRGLGTVSGT